MVLRTFFAFDSEALQVTSSPNASIVNGPVRNNSDSPDGTIYQYSSGEGTTITLDDTGGGSTVFNDGDEEDHVITDGGGIVANGTEVESESVLTLRALDGNNQPVGPEITVWVFSQNGNFADVWGFASSETLVNGTSYIKVDGDNAGASNYTDYVACFCAGTLIRTSHAEQRIEDLHVGDVVWIQETGMKPVGWIGHSQVLAVGAFAPIVFETGSINNARRIAVSPEHRMLVSGHLVEVLFGTPDALVAAKHFVGCRGVHQKSGGIVDYFHLLFDAHHIIMANGVLSESLFVSDHSLTAYDPTHRAEIEALFPALKFDATHPMHPASQPLKAHEAAVLLAQTPAIQHAA